MTDEPIQEAVLIERGLYEQVVEGLRFISQYDPDGPDPEHPLFRVWYDDVNAKCAFHQWIAQRLLAQLEAHRKEGA